MTKHVISGSVILPDDKPARNMKLVVQIHRADAGWKKFASTTTNNEGKFQIEGETNGLVSKFVPAFRLVEARNHSRVMGAPNFIKFHPNQDRLDIDFGSLVKLAEVAFNFEPISTRIATDNIMVAGVFNNTRLSSSVDHRLVATDLGNAAGTIVSANTPDLGPAINKDIVVFTNQEIQTLKAQTHILNAQLAAQKITMDKHSRDIELKKSDLKRLRDERDILKVARAEADAKAQKADTKIKGIENTIGARADVQSVIVNVGQKIDQANTAMRLNKHPFQVANIKLNLKGVFLDNGNTILMNGVPGVGGQVETEAGLTADLIPEDAENVDANINVPDVTTLTESAARRVLVSVGLRLKAAHRAVKNNSIIPGTAIQQHPKAGSQTSRNSDVIVIFAIRAET